MQTRHRLLRIETALVFGLLLASDAGAQTAKKKIVILGRGEKSVVISGVAKTRSRLNAKEVLSAAKQRKEKLKTAREERAETKKRIKAQLTDVDAVAADFSEATEGEDDDELMVKSALEAGVPVVLENASPAKIAKLTGIGVDAKTAVIETSGGGGYFNITILDGPDLKAKPGADVSVTPSAPPVPEDKAKKKALQEYDAKQKAARAKEPQQSQTPASAKLTGAQKTAHVEKIISEKAFKKGAKRHGLFTNECEGATRCVEGSIGITPQPICPEDKCDGNSLAPVLEYGVYKVRATDPLTQKVRTSAYVVTRAAGRPNLKMMADEVRNRGYYLHGYTVSFKASYAQNMNWRLDKATPENANRQATVAYTSGYTLGGEAGVSVGEKTEPAASISFSYTASTTKTLNTAEYGITRATGIDSVVWDHKLQMVGNGRTYNKPEDIFFTWFLSTTDVDTLPDIARLGTDFRTEAIWTGETSSSCGNCTVSIEATYALQLQRAWSEGIPRSTATRPYTKAYPVSATIKYMFATNW